MTKSTITREQLEEWVAQFEEDGGCDATDRQLEALIRQSLAAMDSEPHTDDELYNLLWYSQEAACHSDPNYYCEFQRLATPGLIAGIIRELQERRKADSEPVAWTDAEELRDVNVAGIGYLFGIDREANKFADPRRQIMLYRHAQPAPVVEREPIAWLNDAYLARGVVDGEAGSEDAGPGYIPVYREAGPQPAPVVPDDVLDALQKVARIRLDLNDFDGDLRGIADCLSDAEEALIEVVNRCAAMLTPAPQEVPDGK
ncbi:hypothetical protein RAH25_10630 [Klebsiella quasipneumoniae subsp. similipneumoniae]|uniref:hypothetical protein n=1 Tax=Klebsiella quasipneumoniae TaxID=1463165 RepID=UPI003004703B